MVSLQFLAFEHVLRPSCSPPKGLAEIDSRQREEKIKADPMTK